MASQNNSRYDANGFNSRGRRQIKGFSQSQRGQSPLNQAQAGADKLYSSGMKIGRDGRPVSLRDFGGTMAAMSQQRNSMSPSGGSRPMNDMYLDDPTFFNRRPGGVEGFGQMLAQTREQRIAQSQQDGTFDTIRDKYNQDNQASGQSMNKFGNIMANLNKPQSSEWLTENRPVQFDKSGLPKLPWAGDTAASGQRVANRQALEQGAAGLKLLRETQQSPMQVTESGGAKSIQTQYGTGSSTQMGPKRQEGMVNGQRFSEVMQGLSNKPGVAREGDKFQPQGDLLASATKQNGVKSASDLLKSAPKKLPFTTIPDKKGKQMLASTKRKPLARA